MSATDRTLVAGVAGALVLAAAAAWLLLSPGRAIEDPGLAALALTTPNEAGSVGPVSSGPSHLVVDVEGGVLHPGVRQLPDGARVADAIAAAGGYAPHVDLAAAAAQINLAKPLSDGEQIYVPTADDTAAQQGAHGAVAEEGDTAADGPVDLNTATPEELEALPGIGPVTVDKILAARAEQPFTSLDDAVGRGAINRGQLEKIRDLATAG